MSHQVPIYEEKNANTLRLYLTFTTPLFVGAVATAVYVMVAVPGSMPPRITYFGYVIIPAGLIGMAAMWHTALSRQPFRILPDGIEPMQRPARMAFHRQRRRIPLSEIRSCTVTRVSDSWGRPAFTNIGLALVSGGHLDVSPPSSEARDIEGLLLGFLGTMGVPATSRTVSLSEWEEEKRERRKSPPGTLA